MVVQDILHIFAAAVINPITASSVENTAGEIKLQLWFVTAVVWEPKRIIAANAANLRREINSDS